MTPAYDRIQAEQRADKARSEGPGRSNDWPGLLTCARHRRSGSRKKGEEKGQLDRSCRKTRRFPKKPLADELPVEVSGQRIGVASMPLRDQGAYR